MEYFWGSAWVISKHSKPASHTTLFYRLAIITQTRNSIYRTDFTTGALVRIWYHPCRHPSIIVVELHRNCPNTVDGTLSWSVLC